MSAVPVGLYLLKNSVLLFQLGSGRKLTQTGIHLLPLTEVAHFHLS